jgi:hypothetical protein
MSRLLLLRRKVLSVKPSIGVVLLGIIATSAWAQTATATLPPTKAHEAKQDVDVREAVLRYQIASWELAASSYCVKINGKDADENFLRRLRPLPVKAASECRKQTPPKLPRWLYSIIDKKTKKKSVIFEIGEIRWVKRSEGEVDGGYDCASQCSAWGTYHLVWDGTRWTVTAFDIQEQS